MVTELPELSLAEREQDLLTWRSSVKVGVRVAATDVKSRWGEGPVLREVVQVLAEDRFLVFTPARLGDRAGFLPYTLEEIRAKVQSGEWRFL